ncbi:alpha-amylase family glycosyl hydrolase [Chitinophaga pollutisoli]|uniref:Alpha-amylase family glycosyl hydrolase n=1 Tax=Chitinophaga pollutisoli TaxID=3133966 RepID=A0ABZ2YSA1_9BACT
MTRKTILALLLAAIPLVASAQNIRVFPEHWWAGMQTNQLQLILRGSDSLFGKGTVSTAYPGVEIRKVTAFSNGRYLAVDITLDKGVQPGAVPLMHVRNGRKTTVYWPVKARKGMPGKDFARGISGADLIYLLMPDRFANGDPSNDRVPGMRDQSLDRSDYYARHGGDFAGVIRHLDYLRELGVTALWMTPVMENDMPNRTEHGYAITDHYRIDARYGGNEGYKRLRDSLQARGMKLVQDAVYNHTGTYHVIVSDLPEQDWLNQWPSFTGTSAREQALFDPYASANDKKRMTDGWFVKEMPDWNQRNPYVANFITQNAIWYVEEFGVDAIRLDTYMYNDLAFANACNVALLREYPSISLFGEVMVQHSPNQAFFAENHIATAFKSNLPAVLDFTALFNGIFPALAQEPGWYTGIVHLYNAMAHDFLYRQPEKNVILLDNHDLPRFFTRMEGNVARQKMAYTWLLTARGIPQMYYGSEVLMAGDTKPDGLVRLDFPGGWPGDAKNAFSGEGLTAAEKSMQDLVKKLGTYRKTSPALQSGKFMQYTPQDGLYIYFRYTDGQTVMCAMNTTKAPRRVDIPYLSERTGGFTKARNVIDGVEHSLQDAIVIPAQEMWVLELK